MAEKRVPSLGEINEAIAREHGIDPASLKDYKLPEGPPAHDPLPEIRAAADRLLRAPLRFTGFHTPAAPAVPVGIPHAGLDGPGPPAAGYAGQPREDGRRPSVVPMHSKSLSCFVWTPLQMLKEFVRAIEAGEEAPEGMVIIYTEALPAGGVQVHSWRAQLGWCEEYTYLEVAQQKAIENQRQPG